MGKVLQVRVSVSTHDLDKVAKVWPKLHKLAWPDDEPVYVPHQGVLQLIEALADAHRFADWPEHIRQETGEAIAEAAKLAKELEGALANWDARKANTLTDEIEECLTDLEKRTPNK